MISKADSDEDAKNDADEFERLFREVQNEVHGFIDRRLNSKLRRRLDTSDVLQETQLNALRRYSEYRKNPPMPFRVWLLQTAQQQLIQAYRTHLITAKRSVAREVAWSDCSSVLIAKGLAISGSSPSQHMQHDEAMVMVKNAVDALPEVDQEILLMRHIENRPYDEIAILLDIQPEAARQRCGRALIKLRTAMNEQGLLERDT